MKKFLAAGFLALLITGCAYAAETQDKGYISVNVEATEELDPTLVKISFAIETKEKNADTAANLNKEASTKAIGAVKALVDTGAKERADKIAQSMNTTVAGIKSITAGCSSSSSFNASNYRLLNAKAEAAMDSAGTSVPVESGKTQLRAYVNADFFVK